jgi:hypothetical protein
VSISRRYIEALNEIFGAPEHSSILACLQPEIEYHVHKIEKRRLQRNGNRQPTGNPRGRPKLTAEAAAEAKEKRREYRRRWMSAKRHDHSGNQSAVASTNVGAESAPTL